MEAVIQMGAVSIRELVFLLTGLICGSLLAEGLHRRQRKKFLRNLSRLRVRNEWLSKQYAEATGKQRGICTVAYPESLDTETKQDIENHLRSDRFQEWSDDYQKRMNEKGIR